MNKPTTKRIAIASAILLAAIACSAEAGVYKCGNKYQSSPCDADSPESGQVNIKEQSAEQKAAAAERLQQVRSEYDTKQKQKADEAEKTFEKVMKFSEVQAAQRNAYEQHRQADALERQADNPSVVIVPNNRVLMTPKTQ